jgi:predicted dehydrogenase
MKDNGEKTQMHEIWLIGAGYMAKEYAKVLKGLNREFKVIGRGIDTAADFERSLNIPVSTGGVARYIKSVHSPPTNAIVTVDPQHLSETALILLDFGVKRILLEKPGALSIVAIAELQKVAAKRKAEVFVAYNRRFYSSVLKAREMIEEDGGCTSFVFEFTEWSHLVKDSKKSKKEKAKWLVVNSTHVVDLAFHLGGTPETIDCFSSGGLDWHPSASVFSGSGVSGNGALFSYYANWEAPGRWGVEVLTKKHRLILRPLEELSVQNPRSLDTERVVLDDAIDKLYKPGLYRETESFLGNTNSVLKRLNDQVRDMKLYFKIAGYTS